MKVSAIHISLLVLVFGFPLAAIGQTTWTNGGFGENWYTHTNWDSMTYPNGETRDVVIGSPSPTVLNVFDASTQPPISINSLSVGPDGILLIDDQLGFGGIATTTITNFGRIDIVDSNGNHTLFLSRRVFNSSLINVLWQQAATMDLKVNSGGATLDGGGRIFLGGNASGRSRIAGEVDALLTIQDQTIDGWGNVGGDVLQVINTSGGAIVANGDGFFMVFDAGSLGATNDGLMQATNGGTLKIQDSEIDNSNGTIDAVIGSTVELATDVSILGGQFIGLGLFSTRSALLTDITNDSTIQVRNSSDLRIAGAIENSGHIYVRHSTGSNPTAVSVEAAGATLTGGGTIELSGNVANIHGQSGAVLIIEDQTIFGRGDIGDDLIEIVIGPNGVIHATGSKITVDPIGTDDWTSDGTLIAADDKELDLPSTINNGVIDAAGSGLVEADSLHCSVDGSMIGEGTIRSFGSMTVEGQVSPGHSAGNLTLRSSDGITFGPTAKTDIELFSNILFDSLSIIGDLNIDGDLNITLMGGFVPDPDDTFAIVLGGDQMGAFANESGGVVMTADARGCFTVTYTDASVILSGFFPVTVPETVTPTRGTYVSGTIADLSGSDNADYVLRRSNSDLQSRTEFTVKSTSPVAVPTTMSVRLEGSVFARSAVTQTIELFDYDSGSWEIVDSRAAARFGDSVAQVEVTGDLSRFIELGTQCVEARIRFTSARARQQFSSSTDQFSWTIE